MLMHLFDYVLFKDFSNLTAKEEILKGIPSLT